MRATTTAVICAALLVGLALAPAGATAAEDLSVQIDQDEDDVTILVTDNETAVEGANVTVETVDENETYNGTGEYATDEDGVVDLPAPAEDVEVEVTVEYENATATVTATLQAPEEEPDLDTYVEQDEYAVPTVTVTDDGIGVEGADVTVEAVDENATYEGEGSYVTDENGTVELAVPEDDVEIEVTAEYEGATASFVTTLEALELDVGIEQASDGTATVTVTTNETPVEGAAVTVETVDSTVTYAGTGNYTTDENGTVDLPAPAEPVEIEVTAEYAGATETTTATLDLPEDQPFGQLVSTFVHQLQDDRQTMLGPLVSEFVLANNPGDPPEHAGPPDHVTDDNESAGPPEHAGASNETGPPEHAGGDDRGPAGADDDERGPPADRGPSGDDTERSDSDDADDSSPGNSGNSGASSNSPGSSGNGGPSNGGPP